MSFIPRCLPTTIGSLPHTDVRLACELVLKYTPALPAWPQLPNRLPLENMYAQFSEHLPGTELDNGRVWIKRGPAFDSALEQLYADYVAGDVSRYLPSIQYAAGLHGLIELVRERRGSGVVAAKGQVTGPISIGMQLTDSQMKPILYDDVAGDAVGRCLRLVASAEEKALEVISPRTMVFLDEPYLHAIGSALVSLPRDVVIRQLEEVFGGLRGLKGIHCCGNTDWSLVLSTSVDVVSFDAFHYGETLVLYADDVRDFVNRGGIIAWGIVPNTIEALQAEDVSSLTEALLRLVHRLKEKGVPLDSLVSRSLITPSCGLSGLPESGAERALCLLAGVSEEMRKRFFGRP